MKNIVMTTILMATLLLAQNTVEDEQSPDVVDDLAPPVRMIPNVQEEMQPRAKIFLDDNESMLEVVNGVVRRKIIKSDTEVITEVDKEAEAVENLEPKSIDSL